MLKRVSYILLLLFFLCACKRRGFSIQDTTSLVDGKTDKTLVEGLLATGLDLRDTLLYYKFDFLTDVAVFKQNPDFDLGITYSHSGEGDSHSFNLEFRSISKEDRSDTLQIVTIDNKKILTTRKYQKLYKFTGTAFTFENDKYLNPVTSTAITSEERMTEFLRLFEPEIRRTLRKNSIMKYTSTTHIDGYFQDIKMKIEY